MRYSEINELFDTNPPALQREDDGYSSDIKIGSQIFSANFFEEGNDEWEFSFYLRHDSQNKFTPTGDQGSSAVRIYSWAIGLLDQFLRTVHPNTLSFSGQVNTGQAAFYEKLVQKLEAKAQQLGYTIDRDASVKNRVAFILHHGG